MPGITLPPGPEKLMDQTRLSVLIRDALFAAIRDLKGIPIEETEWLVFRPSPEAQVSLEQRYSKAPNYRSSTVWEALDAVARSEEARTLTEYVWTAGALKKKLWRDDDKLPEKNAWERFVWGDLVHGPLLYVLELKATSTLSEDGSYESWAADDRELEAAATDLANAVCSKGKKVQALCPILFADLPNGFSASSPSGIELRRWTLEERCLFLTRHHHQYHPEEMAPSASDCLLRIERQLSVSSDQEVVRFVSVTLDRVKWASMVSADLDTSFEEGAVILRSPSGWRGRTIRREDTFMRTYSRKLLRLDNEAVQRAFVLFERAESFAEAVPEFDSALWFLGRSLVAPSTRDSLLEAAIGLEMLLVPDAGESRYKFGLHGSAVLSQILKQDTEPELKRIYDLRSKAAHGSSKNDGDFDNLAPRARYLLAQALVGVLDLVDSGELRPSETGGDLGKATREMVKRRCVTW